MDYIETRPKIDLYIGLCISKELEITLKMVLAQNRFVRLV